MTDQPETPQLYLITPTAFEIDSFVPQLSAILDTTPIACVRMALAETDESALSRAADALRECCHARDIAIVIDRHAVLSQQLGLDGVHLTDGARNIRKLRETMGEDAIIGVNCGASRHDGMNAGEAGADYVSFGPVGDTPLGDGQSRAEFELFEWWSAMIEVPVVAEGALTPENVAELLPVTDFFAVGPEIWPQADPLDALKTLTSPLGL